MTLANFDELLAKYAHLLIKKGLNVGLPSSSMPSS